MFPEGDHRMVRLPAGNLSQFDFTSKDCEPLNLQTLRNQQTKSQGKRFRELEQDVAPLHRKPAGCALENGQAKAFTTCVLHTFPHLLESQR